MPGPGRIYGPALADAVRRARSTSTASTRAVRRLLTVFDRLGAFDDPADARPAAVDRPEHRALCRSAATEATVLLRNEADDGDRSCRSIPGTLTSLAVIGPNADRAQIMGGGSASLAPHYRITPLDAIRERLGDSVDVGYEQGSRHRPDRPPLGIAQLTAPDGEPGFG